MATTYTYHLTKTTGFGNVIITNTKTSTSACLGRVSFPIRDLISKALGKDLQMAEEWDFIISEELKNDLLATMTPKGKPKSKPKETPEEAQSEQTAKATELVDLFDLIYGITD